MGNVILNASSSVSGQLPSQVLGLTPVLGAGMAALIIILVLWSIVWKGIALWKSARLGQKWWFIIMLVVNTVGILEIIYIFFVAKKRERKNT